MDTSPQSGSQNKLVSECGRDCTTALEQRLQVRFGGFLEPESRFTAVFPVCISQSRRRLHPDAVESSTVERASANDTVSFFAINLTLVWLSPWVAVMKRGGTFRRCRSCDSKRFTKTLFWRDAPSASPKASSTSTRDTRATQPQQMLACDGASAEAKWVRRAESRCATGYRSARGLRRELARVRRRIHRRKCRG
jgi:hypothetical protein